MGIPSYFKRLTESVRGILSSQIQGAVSCLLVDFNCIVYGCLRSTTLPPYTLETEEAWERALNEEVCKTLVGIWTAASRPAKVFIAVDGVVPMAKIKQQRMRRFKSLWWAEKEYETGVRKHGVERWDTNAITPGTAYMEVLGRRLQQLCAARPGWTVSTSDEPGEGEHKAMAWIRNCGSGGDGTVVVYGLDADLILLAMLTGREYLTQPCVLMREKTEFGKEAAKFGAAPFLFFSVQHLLSSLCPKAEEPSFLLDYVAVMCLLGNDFLPHGLTLKIRDGGHDVLLGKMRGLRAAGLSFVDYETKAVNYETFRRLFEELATTEEASLLQAIYTKKSMRPMPPRSDAERLMMSVQGLPAQWFVEKEFLEGGRLRTDWKEVYEHHVPVGAVKEYLYGIQWVVNYYVGRPVDLMWYYPWHLPPLWSQLANSSKQVPLWSQLADSSKQVPLWSQLADSSKQVPLAEAGVQEPLKPQEQLAIVLPMESWHLVRNADLRRAPALLPQFWPKRFGFMSLGKSWMWECEADIPILTPGRLRFALKT